MRRRPSLAGWDAGDGSTGCLEVGRQLDAIRGRRRGCRPWLRATGLVLVAIVLLPCAASASAATVSLPVTSYLFDHGSGSGTSAILEYSAVAAETSTTRVSFALHRFTVTDSTAPLQAHAGCRQVDPGTVTCDEPLGTSASGARVRLGGGRNDFTLGEVHADRFLGSEVLLGFEVFGGPSGNRIDLSRATAPAQLHGGAGDDALIGGQGDDLFMPGGGVNTIDGGGGVNTVSYADATGPVHASLAEGIGRAPGRLDHLTRVQNLNGSPFDDVLIGDDGPNALNGQAATTS